MKVKDVMALQSQCDEFSVMLKACIHDHGVIEIPDCREDELLNFFDDAWKFMNDVIKSTEIFK